MLVVALDGLLVLQQAQRQEAPDGDTPRRTPAELKYLDRIYRFAAANGFSPVDRARMPAGRPADTVNPLERFLRKGR
jgi:hypothetical protein